LNKQDIKAYVLQKLDELAESDLSYFEVYGFVFEKIPGEGIELVRGDLTLNLSFEEVDQAINALLFKKEKYDPFVLSSLPCVYFELGGRSSAMRHVNRARLSTKREVDEKIAVFLEMIRFIEPQLANRYDFGDALRKFRFMTSPWEVHIGGWEVDDEA
jgi:hypothetical protein